MEQWIGPQSVGMVGGLLIILGAGMRGIWEFSFQHQREIKAKDAIIERLDNQLKEQAADFEKRLAKEEEEKNEYKNFTLQLLDLQSRVAAIAEKKI